MSTYLAGNTEILITNNQWIQVLRLARMYRWQPAGTESPAHWEHPDFGIPSSEWNAPWPWNYRLNDWQRVTNEDAQAMGAALQNALDDIPDCDGLQADWKMKIIVGHNFFTSEELASLIAHDTEMNPLEFWGGNRKDTIRRIVELCQAGFAIA